MNLKVNENYSGFKLIQEEEIKEIEAIGRIFYHEKSGATLISIANSDPHKVFTITFQTPPHDNSGAAHIVEHTVCCASEKYPLKETFMEIQKGSICTTLNACTYPDMTMYYAASENEKDLSGIMKVYMDLVFHPMIYKDSQYFKQEGWRYEIEDAQDRLTYGGIVYNEMEGEYAEATTHLQYGINQSLFPNTVYQYDAGGVPEEIVKLTEESFLDFHKTYYHGANSYIYLYGNGDLKEQLRQIDEECLSHLKKRTQEINIPLQEASKEPCYKHIYYPITNKGEQEAKALLSLSFVIETAPDAELRLAFELLEHMLLRSIASPLAEALVVKGQLGIGMGEGGYDPCRQQPVFSIVLKGTSPDNISVFEEKVFEVLRNLVQDGMPMELVDAALQTIEFEIREGDASYEPMGIVYSEMILNSYLYGGEAFTHLKYEKHLEKIKRLKDKGYFESLIQKYLIDNPHRVLTLLEPSLKEGKRVKRKKEKSLQLYKKSLDKASLKQLIAMNKQLTKAKLIPNTKEALALLPTLTREDIDYKVEAIQVKEIMLQGTKVLFHTEATKGIVYMHLLFDAQVVTEEEVPYVGLLAHMLTYLGAGEKSYIEIENAINTYTGGINCALHAYSRLEEEGIYQPLLKITSKVLISQMDRFLTLITSLLTKTRFNEKDKIKEILGNIKYELERSFTGAPEYRATRRLYTYFSPEGEYEDRTSGIQFYYFIKECYEAFDESFEIICEQLKNVYDKIIRSSGALVSVTAEEVHEERLLKEIGHIMSALKEERLPKVNYTFKPTVKNEAYIIGQNVQAVAKGFNFIKSGFKYHGTLEVLANILESTYLWERIRLQGGAYGCDLLLSREGHLVLCSYCDPHLNTTIKAYDEIAQFLKKLKIDKDELERYILSTIGTMKAPLSMEQKSERALTYYLCHMTEELLSKAMEEVLQTTAEDLVHFAPLFEAMAKENNVCVIGSEKQIKKHKKLFNQLIDYIF